MTLFKNERGISLLEVLVVIGLLSMVSVLIYSVFFQGSKFTEKSVSQNQLQQEANLISQTLVKAHQTSESYLVKTFENEFTVVSHKEGSDISDKFNNPLMEYDISGQTTVNPKPIHDTEIDPNLTDVNVTIKISDRKDASNSVVVKTVLSRLKSSVDESEASEESEKELPDNIDLIEKPIITPGQCDKYDQINNNLHGCSSFLISNDDIKPINISLDGVTNKTIYSQGYGKFEKSASNMQNMKLYFDRGAIFNEDLGMSNSILQFKKGDASFQKNVSLDDSKVVIYSSSAFGTTSSNFNVNNSSFIYFGNQLELRNTHLKISGNSKVCIYKPSQFTMSGSSLVVEDKSALYLFDSNGGGSNPVLGASYITSANEWIEKCGVERGK